MIDFESDPFEFAAAIKKLVDATIGLGSKKLAAKAKMSESRLHQILALNNVIEPIRQLYRDGMITLSSCTNCGHLPPERQVGYIERTYEMSVENGNSHQLSIYADIALKPKVRQLVCLIGQPRVARMHLDGGTFTWHFGDAHQLVRSIGYARRLGLMPDSVIQTEGGR